MRWGVAPFITGEGGHLLARVNLSSRRLEREAQHNPGCVGHQCVRGLVCALNLRSNVRGFGCIGLSALCRPPPDPPPPHTPQRQASTF